MTTNLWVEPGAGERAPFRPDQLKRAKAAAAQDLASGRSQIAAKFELGDVCAEITEESDQCAADALAPLANELKYSTDTLVRYLRVTKTAGQPLRSRLATSSVHVTWETLKAACVVNDADRSYRVDVLLNRLGAAERMGLACLDEEDYRKAVGLGVGAASQAEEGKGPAASAVDLDAALGAVAQAIAEDPAQQERFVQALVQEGGLEVLETVSAGLRKARVQERQWERNEYEEPASEQEQLLQAFLRVSKALEKPLGYEPADVVAALPLEQFEAVDRMCRSVGEWHMKLLAAAGTTTEEKVA
ncbi:hypothetical protein C0216_30965 (plasmid) [Streptomyces globosus]|uniref:Uncharacterized protein n=1 Tax=Streptomyces globosus TaxID=68209 RepID=A0A344UAK4_9ACTN|nr:hypothetical protein [Streptomyces globosus]AXE27925.1 hypothetical protein C0216_30965 [Streptomyces globosus]